MKIKEYANHDSIPKKYKWDLSFLLGDESFEKLVLSYKRLFKKRIKNKQTKFENSDNFYKDLKDQEKMQLISNKISNYLSNSISIDITNAKFNSMHEKLSFELFQLEQEFGSEINRFFQHSSKISKWIEEKRFKEWKHKIKAILEEKKHKLPNQIEDYRLNASRGNQDVSSIFSILTDTELNYGFAVNSKGKKTKITTANRIKLMKNKDESLRKSTFNSYREAFLKHKASLSNMLFQHFKTETVEAKLRKYNSTLEYLLNSDRVSIKFLETLYSEVSNNKNIFKKYSNNWKKFYKLKFGSLPKKWDLARELVDVKSSYSIEEAEQIVFESIKPMGEEYASVVKKAFEEKWIDYMPTKTKRSGAYSIGSTKGIEKKLILMNFDGDLRSVETLAHEMGHSLHSYFSDKNQHIANSNYTIFVAEIASIFNELMLFDHILKNTENDKLKFKIRESMITGFIGTVMRQVEWSNFEADLYKGIEEGKPLNTYESISKLYYENSKKYSNKIKKYNEKDQYMSIVVPHFYYGFYVYKYAIGQLVANIFFMKYKKEGIVALENYINNFLSAGGRDWPLKILKDAGIDLEDKNIYKIGFDYVEENINEWVRLGNKIFINKEKKWK